MTSVKDTRKPASTTGDSERDGLNLLSTVWAPDLSNVPLPVDPVYIARQLGIEVYNAQLESDVSGMLRKKPHQDPEIYLNLLDSMNRRRFTCAHEIGHYIERQRHDGESWAYVDQRGPRSSRGTHHDEVYANGFAASLLMPEPVVERLQEKGHGIPEMAYRFGVSVEAMTHRTDNRRGRRR